MIDSCQLQQCYLIGSHSGADRKAFRGRHTVNTNACSWVHVVLFQGTFLGEFIFDDVKLKVCIVFIL